MLQYGQPGGAMGGGAAPLSSAELLTGALQDISDVASGESARRNAANQLELELGRVKLDQLRAGGLQVQPSAVANVGNGLPPLGRRAATVMHDVETAPPVFSGGDVDTSRSRFPAGLQLGPLSLSTQMKTSDASRFEDRYGDALGSLLGLGVFATDVGHTIGQFARRRVDGAVIDRRHARFDRKSPSQLQLRRPAYPGWMDDMYPKGKF